MFKIIRRRPMTVSSYNLSIPQKEKHIKQCVLLLLFTAGVVAGSLVIRRGTGDILSEFLNIYKNYITAKAGESLVTGFCNSFFISVVLLIVIYSLGICAVGTPALYVIPIINGIGIGTISSYLYSKFLLKGIGYCALICYPGKIVSTVIMVAACTSGINMSTKILKILTSQEENVSFKEYNIKFLIFTGFMVVSALCDTILNTLFGSYFDFI